MALDTLEPKKKYPDPAVAQHEPLFVTDAEDSEPMIEEEDNLSQVIKERFWHLFCQIREHLQCVMQVIPLMKLWMSFSSYQLLFSKIELSLL